MTGSKPEEQPNEPKINPQGASMGHQNMKIQPPSHTEHISVPIDKVHVFGSKAEDKSPMHTDTKSASAKQMPGYGNQTKVQKPKTPRSLSPRLPKPKA